MKIVPYARKAQFYETDQMGVIHHAHYIHWFEEARVDFLAQIGFPYERVESLGITFAVLELSCRYKSPVRFGDTVHILVGLAACSHSQMTLDYRVTDAVTGELRTTGETRHYFFRKEDARPVSLKKAIPDLYDLFRGLSGEARGQTRDVP
ncbi:MAG: acyl-CoA thioesterase [Synergistaceae bacterium]|jgi:acyl-CoA thioester hydrolase|nr:acyl-CoA thioesterase [Synergistaceae bacterium]